MGMINETIAMVTATRLEKILMDAMTSGNDTIKEFARKNLYQWYLNECTDTLGLYEPNPEIVNIFKKISNSIPHNIGGTMFTTNE